MRVLLWYLCCLLNSSKIKPSEARCKSYIDLNKKYITNLYKFIVKFIFCTTAENWCKWGTKCWPPFFYSLFYLTKIVNTFNLFLFIWKKYILHTLSTPVRIGSKWTYCKNCPTLKFNFTDLELKLKILEWRLSAQ